MRDQRRHAQRCVRHASQKPEHDAAKTCGDYAEKDLRRSPNAKFCLRINVEEIEVVDINMAPPFAHQAPTSYPYGWKQQEAEQWPRGPKFLAQRVRIADIDSTQPHEADRRCDDECNEKAFQPTVAARKVERVTRTCMKRSKHHPAREPACARKALLTTTGTIFVPFIFLLLLAWKSAKNEIFRVGPFQVAKCTFDTRAC